MPPMRENNKKKIQEQAYEVYYPQDQENINWILDEYNTIHLTQSDYERGL